MLSYHAQLTPNTQQGFQTPKCIHRAHGEMSQNKTMLKVVEIEHLLKQIHHVWLLPCSATMLGYTMLDYHMGLTKNEYQQ